VIPVLIVPVLDNWDSARRMLKTVSAKRTVIVDNGRLGMRHAGAEHIRPILNLGFSGSINAGIGQTPEAPWWMWASVDVEFTDADLINIIALMESATGPRVVTGDRSDDRLLRFAYAAINREAIEAVGLLDEWTFYPLYYEDDDYQYRCQLGGVEWVEYNGAIKHQRSMTIRAPARAMSNAATFPANARAYQSKWGGLPSSERFSRPWDLPVPLDYTRPDIAARAKRTW
jgi:hypothetical protein